MIPSQHKVMLLSLEVHRDSTSVLFFTSDKVIAITLQLSKSQYSRNKNNGMKKKLLDDWGSRRSAQMKWDMIECIAAGVNKQVKLECSQLLFQSS